MQPSRRALLASIAAAGPLQPLAALAQPGAGAATPPPAPEAGALRLVVGFPPGGALDTLARALGERLRTLLGLPVIVDNRPGASSRVSIEHVKRSAPDGLTVLLAASAPFTIFPATYAQLAYDLDRDFIPVAHLVNVPTVVSTGADQPYRTIEQYVDWVRAHPDRSGFGLTNLGGALHFAILAMGNAIGVKLSPVPYKGGAPLAADIIGGHVPVGTDALASQLALHREGRLRILGLSGSERNAMLADVPTLKERGIGGFEHATASYSAFVPAGTPAAQVGRLEQALIDALQGEQIRSQLAKVGLDPTGYRGRKLAAMLHAERDFWRPIVAASGFRNTD